jgi:DNA invertase Pin-like site-specific DNA recombinase
MKITGKLTGVALSYSRYSSAEQGSGTSVARQRNRFNQFIKYHNLETLEPIIDEKKSAFNITSKGKLGVLVEDIEKGKIDVKSKKFYLVIEDLDRFSREKPKTSLMRLFSLLELGVNIITLSDYELYDENADENSIFKALNSLIRAHSESSRKSDILKETYKEKWKAIIDGTNTKKLNSCPKWIEQVQETLIKDGKKIKVWKMKLIPEKAAVIKKIFEWAEFHGKPTIKKMLMEEGIPTFTGRKVWSLSSVNNFFKDRRVIGERDLHEMKYCEEKKKQIPVKTGVTVAEFYPPAITIDLYNKAQEHTEKRTLKYFKDKDYGKNNNKTASQGIGGRTGNKGNLFTGLLICMECGGNYSHYTNVYKTQKYHYIKCKNYVQKLGCKNKPVRYDYLEKLFFTYIKEIDFSLLLSDRSSNFKLHKFEADKAEIMQRINTLEVEQGNLVRGLKAAQNYSDGEIDIFGKELGEIQNEKSRLLTQLKKINLESDEIKVTLNKPKEQFFDLLKQYKSIITSNSSQQKHDLHLIIRNTISGVIIDGKNKLATVLLNINKLNDALYSIIKIKPKHVELSVNVADLLDSFVIRFPVEKDFYELCEQMDNEVVMAARVKMHPDIEYLHRIDQAIKLNNDYYENDKYAKFKSQREEISSYLLSVEDHLYDLIDQQVDKVIQGEKADVVVEGKLDLSVYSIITDKNEFNYNDVIIKNRNPNKPRFKLETNPNLKELANAGVNSTFKSLRPYPIIQPESKNEQSKSNPFYEDPFPHGITADIEK